MTMLKGQSDVSPSTPMPVDLMDSSPNVLNVPAETLTWFYISSSAWASATSQAAGTVVQGKLAYGRLLNSSKGSIGSYNNTSFAFAASTRFDTLVTIPDEILSKMQSMTPTEQKNMASSFFVTNGVYDSTKGYYAIDHRRGQIWGRPKATVANDTVSYSSRVFSIDQPTASYTITPSDSTDLSGTVTKGITVDVVAGSTTTIAFKLLGDSSASSRILSASAYIPGRFLRVMGTGTTLNSATVIGYGG